MRLFSIIYTYTIDPTATLGDFEGPLRPEQHGALQPEDPLLQPCAQDRLHLLGHVDGAAVGQVCARAIHASSSPSPINGC